MCNEYTLDWLQSKVFLVLNELVVLVAIVSAVALVVVVVVAVIDVKLESCDLCCCILIYF